VSTNVDWLKEANLRPYILIRKDNRVERPGSLHSFPFFSQPLILDPQELKNAPFCKFLLVLDEFAFKSDGLTTPGWVFYDAALMPGVVCGFCVERDSMEPGLIKRLNPPAELDWIPLSLFTIIPTMRLGHWMAHNFISMNSFVDKAYHVHRLGFLSKAFGLWYVNAEYLYGVTQWDRPALKFHANYGDLEVVTAYTPIHTKADSLTYRLKVDTVMWHAFLDGQPGRRDFSSRYVASGVTVKRDSVKSMLNLQAEIEANKGPFFLDGRELAGAKLDGELSLYRPAKKVSS